MISQADIIRSLVNKNCTDEAIMSTALSPDCTLPKLLQRFTEAERFDLALDVYMKLGMDVVPLWKTWAMRCLRNRDFQGAREKFKHCFQRFRSSAGRFGVATNSLLGDILKELIRMKETKPPLSEEIESIVKGKNNDTITETSGHTIAGPPSANISETKPKIFSECMHYLKEYGTAELLIKFYVNNKLWREAIMTLVQAGVTKDKSEGFFIANVVTVSEACGHFDKVVAHLLELDPYSDRTYGHFNALYDHLAQRYNTLYYVQREIGDYVRAAENQVRNFFLRRPMHDYKELNSRLPSLVNASDDYNRHLKRGLTKDSSRRPKVETRQGANQTSSSSSSSSYNSFIAHLSHEETELRLKIINTQMEITRNFAINEVTGCVGNIEVIHGTGQQADCVDQMQSREGCDSPVTLFDECPRRKTFLAALILIYFDLDCANYISDSGFELSNKIVNEDNLDKLSVFKTAMNIIIDDESSDIIENASLLLKRLRDDYIACTQRTKLKQQTPSTTMRARTTGNSPSVKEGANTISKHVISRPRESEKSVDSRPRASTSALSPSTNRTRKRAIYNFEPPDKSVRPGSEEAARLLCDQVIRDSIKSCREEDYKMELIKLLSSEAKVVLYIELGKLSVAQRLAFDMRRPDFVRMVLREAERLNQDHVKDVCQHWLAKH